MKPPYLKKLSKKQLKKAYSDQWKQNIQVVTENYNLNRDNERLQTIVYNQDQEIHVKAIALTEHFGKIQDLNFLLDHERRERTKVELEAVDLEEALSRSRQLRKSFQEVADRKHGEKAKIDDMAKNLLVRLCEQEWASSKQMAKDLGITITEAHTQTWEELTEEERDDLRVQVTHIISHLPTDDKQDGQTLDEGKAG